MIREYTFFQGDKVPASWEKGDHTRGRQFLPQVHTLLWDPGDQSLDFSPSYTHKGQALGGLQGLQVSLDRQEESLPIA